MKRFAAGFAFSLTIALAAAWDSNLAYEYGELIGRELRDQQYQASLGAGVNLMREPRNGRNFEYAGEDPILAGKTVAQLEALPKDLRAFIVRLRGKSGIVEPTPNTVIREGDIIAVIGRQQIHTRGDEIGPEVSDTQLLDIPVEALDVVVTNRGADGKTLAELARLDTSRGVFLSRLSRSGVDMPVEPGTILDRGDVMRLVGTVPEVERAAATLGYPDRATAATDMVFVGLGIFLGGLVGLLSVVVWGIPLTLTASGGALVMGLVFGWLRSVYPVFGRIPEPAIWIFDTLGLCVFIGVVGITAGPGFVTGLQKTGVSLVIVGLICSLTPHIVAILFGRYVLRMNPLILLGASAGAGTITAALRAIQDEAQSKVPDIGYTVPYAIGNILLTAWGPVLVALMSRG
jgi:putative transport protein